MLHIILIILIINIMKSNNLVLINYYHNYYQLLLLLIFFIKLYNNRYIRGEYDYSTIGIAIRTLSSNNNSELMIAQCDMV